jgi:hypothetical protein
VADGPRQFIPLPDRIALRAIHALGSVGLGAEGAIAMRAASFLCAIGITMLLPVCGAQAQIYSGNDTGGIIPWSCQIEPVAGRIAAGFCARYNKYARITGVQRHLGDYISFECLWSPHVGTYARPAVPLYSRGCSPLLTK